MDMVSLQDVWLKYRIEFKENGRVTPEDFWALKGASLSIRRGEIVGLIGENGAGKTTILKMVAGMLKPDRGSVAVAGTVSTLMEIGAGFQKDLTGRENVYLVSSLFGLTKEQIQQRYDDIVGFAEIGRFIHAPVRVYSQGMYMRLAFSIAIHVDPDILLVDDILAVGDIHAQRKCINKIFQLKDQGKTILFVTQDIELSKRLCTRGIFIRDGLVIKDGPIDKVCSYYIESVGDKKGIALIQKGDLGVVFNNGKLILRWADGSVSSNSAGTSIVTALGRTYVSTTAQWLVSLNGSPHEITAVGTWPDMPLSQHWKVTILNEREFLWEIMLRAEQDASIDKFEAQLLLDKGYTGWFTLKEGAAFPERFIHDIEWDITRFADSAYHKVVGFQGNARGGRALPVMIIDRFRDNADMSISIGNTGSDKNARVIQYQGKPLRCDHSETSGYQCFSARVACFENAESPQLRAYLDCARQTAQESVIISKDAVSLFCSKQKVEIYWHDVLVTRGGGMQAKFRCNNKYLSTRDGNWRIAKKSGEEIAITISWPDEPHCIQAWRLALGDNGSMSWEIEMDLLQGATVVNRQVELELSDDYQRWMTIEEAGDFSRLSKPGNTVILNKYLNDRIGLERVSGEHGILVPSLLFDRRGDTPTVSYLSKKRSEQSASTAVRYLAIDRKEQQATDSRAQAFFSGTLRVYSPQDQTGKTGDASPESAAVRQHTQKPCRIEDGKLQVVFEHGKGRIFWDGTELTRGIGMYTSVLFQETWYDSTQAFWQIQGAEKNRIVALGKWPWVPMEQTWDITLLHGRTIAWKIAKETWDDVALEKEQVNLMLSDRYREWFTDSRIRGNFPEKFSMHNGRFWDRLWCGASTSTIGVRKIRLNKNAFFGTTLPALTLGCSLDCQGRYFVIENTDDLFKARVLQYEVVCAHGDDGQKGEYFNGQIHVTV